MNSYNVFSCTLEDYFINTSDDLSNWNWNPHLSERCPVSYRLWQYLFPCCMIKTGQVMANLKFDRLFDLVTSLMMSSVYNISSTTRHSHLYSCKILFVWHQSFIVKLSTQASWQTHTNTETNAQIHMSKTSSPRYRGWSSYAQSMLRMSRGSNKNDQKCSMFWLKKHHYMLI